MGDIFPLVAVAPGGRLQNHALFISYLDGEPVQLEHQHHGLLADESAQLVYLLGLVQGQQGSGVGDLVQPVPGGPAHGLGGRIAHLDAQGFLQLGQFVKQAVKLPVIHRGGVEVVVFPAVLV